MDTTEPGCVVAECRYCMARKQSLINNNTSKEVSSVLTAQNQNANNKPIKQRQSPIDIRIAKLHYAPEVCRPELLKLSYHSGDCSVLYVNPTGFRVDASENSQTTISAPHLPSGRFRFAQFHAHWGADQHCGSEHRLNGRSYAGEVHFVFYNIKYGNFCSAANHRDGLAVLAVFIRETDKDNFNYKALIDNVKKALQTGRPVNLPKDFHIERLFPSPGHRDFITYHGSLTTVPFSESVTWTVFLNNVSLSHAQLNVFRSIIDSNNRECQNLNGRSLKSSKKFADPKIH